MSLPKDDLCRAVAYAPSLVRTPDSDTDAMPTLTGRFAVFNQWTEINSLFEGRFLERVAPGAFKKTIREGREGMRVLFQHGHDPQIGDKPLGPIRELREDEEGAYYEVPLLDTSYNRDLVPGLEAGLYGASFRFRVVREEVVDDPGPGEHNPLGLPERTVKEAQVHEFGPVTFPAYAGASAGVRSAGITDELSFARFVALADDPERMERITGYVQALRAGVHDTAELERLRARVADLESSAATGGDIPPSDEERREPQNQDDQGKAPTSRVTPRRSFLTMETIGKEEPWRL